MPLKESSLSRQARLYRHALSDVFLAAAHDGHKATAQADDPTGQHVTRVRPWVHEVYLCQDTNRALSCNEAIRVSCEYGPCAPRCTLLQTFRVSL